MPEDSTLKATTPLVNGQWGAQSGNPPGQIRENSMDTNTSTTNNPQPVRNQPFTITFAGGNTATGMLVSQHADPQWILKMLGLTTPKPAIFITGGAGYMTAEDQRVTEQIIEEGVARFAQENQVTVVDGGTESGVMQLIGEARRKHGYTFPLIGVAPAAKVQYPGYSNPTHEAELEDSHSHFVLVDAPDWGDESQMIVQLTRAMAEDLPTLGILINGGKISKQDVYLATARGTRKIPILVLEGSGRFADDLATAFRTGKTNQSIIKAIIAGGDIELTSTTEGADAMWKKLVERFEKK